MKFLQLRYLFALIRGLRIKFKYGSAVQFNLMRTYFGPGSNVTITGGGSISIDGSKDRVYFEEDCRITCSGGSVVIGYGAFFNRGCSIVSHEHIEIGADCMFGPNVHIFDSDHVIDDPTSPFRAQGYKKKAVTLGKNCWFGVNSVITRGTSTGSSVVVGANSVVRGYLEGAHLYVGSPAMKVRSLSKGRASSS